MPQENDPTRGGRGKRAPYKTIMYRIPAPLKSSVEAMAASYREMVSGFEDVEDPDLIATACRLTPINPGVNLNAEDKELLDRILRQSLKLKANSEEQTKQRIREIIAVLSSGLTQ